MNNVMPINKMDLVDISHDKIIFSSVLNEDEFMVFETDKADDISYFIL